MFSVLGSASGVSDNLQTTVVRLEEADLAVGIVSAALLVCVDFQLWFHIPAKHTGRTKPKAATAA